MSLSNRRQNKKIFKTFKDYSVPIIIVLVFLILFINYLFPIKTNNDKKNNENIVWANIVINDLSNTSWEIILENWDKIELKNNSTINKKEKVKIAKWDAKIILEWIWEFVINRLWELVYNEDWTFTLISSDLWVNLKSNFKIETKYMTAYWKEWSVFALSQNEVASSAYVLSWILEITSNSWQKTVLQKWEKIVIMRNIANDPNADLSSLKEEIDEYTKNDDFFIKNMWNSFLNLTENKNLVSTWTTNNSYYQNNYLEFTSIRDEQEISSDIINIEWIINNEIIKNIEINWYNAEISWNNFLIKDYKLKNSVEDIIYKAYDDNLNLITKWVITLYYSKWMTKSEKDSFAQVINYEIQDNDEYKIIAPNQNPFTTTGSVVRIEWIVPYWMVEKIKVNWFELKKFYPYSTKWAYFANSEYDNLKTWVNIYNVKYFGKENKLIYENNFVIIKK